MEAAEINGTIGVAFEGGRSATIATKLNQGGVRLGDLAST